jgi:chemotaxis response regulator CheB
MPLAAIQTGAVHAVLRPNDVAQAIVDFFHTRDIARETREWSEPFAAD